MIKVKFKAKETKATAAPEQKLSQIGHYRHFQRKKSFPFFARGLGEIVELGGETPLPIKSTPTHLIWILFKELDYLNS